MQRAVQAQRRGPGGGKSSERAKKKKKKKNLVRTTKLSKIDAKTKKMALASTVELLVGRKSNYT